MRTPFRRRPPPEFWAEKEAQWASRTADWPKLDPLGWRYEGKTLREWFHETCREASEPVLCAYCDGELDVVARDVFGAPGEGTEQRILRGHAVMASFTRGKGEVFNGGTTEWAHALNDPFVAQITRNVLKRFGAY